MKSKTILMAVGVMATGILLSQCNLAGNGSSSGASDESNTEAAISGALAVLSDDNSSASAASASVATLTTDVQNLQVGVGQRLLRHHCEDSSSVEEIFSCNNAAGTVSRVVTYTDCAISNSSRDGVLNGSFTNTITNGGDGLCDSDNTINFENMVMGRTDDQDGFLAAVHTHQTGANDLVFSFTNARNKLVTVTRTAESTVTFTDPIDGAGETVADGKADSVTMTVERNVNFVHEINGEEVHNLTVFTTDEDFVSSDDSDPENIVESTVEVSLPVHGLVFDSNGEIDSRTITSGNLIVDHNVAKTRLVFAVGNDGLTFDDGTTCGPVAGSMTVTGYEIKDDNTIGAVVGTGEVVFADGEVQSSVFDGEDLNIRSFPCQ